MRVIVAGALANKPLNGGEAWVRLSWIRGLEALGAEVYFVEHIAKDACVDEHGAPAPFEASCNLAHFRAVTREFGLEHRAVLIHDGGSAIHGATLPTVLEIADAADLLVNISGHLEMPSILERIGLRAYIDIDPGYTQIWHARGEPGLRMAGHDLYFTIGENIGTRACSLPSCGIDWIPVRQPVVLDDWPVQPRAADAAFTTVASWRGAYGRIDHEGRTYGPKAHEFRKVADLPARVGPALEIALDIHPADRRDRDLLLGHGWRLTDPRERVPGPHAFRRYVAGSLAEFSVAQGVYVETASGWFSDRTTRYLAMGRPAVVQDTGFGERLPVGDGLLAFRTPAEAVRAIEDVADNYEHHSRAARSIAERCFDAAVVLPEFLDAIDRRRPRAALRPGPSIRRGRQARPVSPRAPSSRKPLTIVVSGMMAGIPGQGGATWAVLQYLLGLRRLGHDVHFIEPIDAREGGPLADSASAAYLEAVARPFGLGGRVALVRRATGETWGRPWGEVVAAVGRADLLLNLSGQLRDDRLTGRIPVRAYVDLDPGFSQLWHEVQGVDMGFDGHSHFVTVGLALGSADCPVPLCGLDWIPTVQPIVLDEWPARDLSGRQSLTTVANWRGYGSVERDGVVYGQKAHSLREFFELPGRTDVPFELALSIHERETRDLDLLRRHGWSLIDPATVASTPERYRRFVRDSWAEFGIAKSGYVNSRCGWFSDRSLCYLASGRPVLAQETGFSAYLPVDEGILPFDSAPAAVAGIEALRSDYARHARAARAIAEAVFDSDRVLPRLLQRLGVQ